MSAEAEPRSSSPWRRVALACLALAAVAVAFAVAARLNQASGAAARLRAAADALDAAEPGWRLEEIGAARPDLPDPENSALAIERAVKLLPNLYATGPLDDKLQHVAPTQPCDPALRQAVADELATFAPALAEARRLADLPRGRFQIDLSVAPVLMRFGCVDQMRSVLGLLRLDVWDRAEAGDTRAALSSCRAMINATRSLGDEPFLAIRLQYFTYLGFALSAAERVLARGEAADADLAELQALVASEERRPTGGEVVRGACGELHATFLWLEQNPPRARGVRHLFRLADGGLDEWHDSVFGVSVADLRRQHAVALERLAGYAEVASLPPHEQAAAEAPWAAEREADAKRYRWLRALLPDMPRAGAAWRRKLGLSRAMLALLAVERFRLRHSRWPARLEDVPKELLATVPLDPADGKPLRYKRTADGVVVYALGEDLTDDGGSVERPAGAARALDHGYRLWDAAKRRQPVPR
jgi:hypothetical protein